jgi:hypothetical protein
MTAQSNLADLCPRLRVHEGKHSPCILLMIGSDVAPVA